MNAARNLAEADTGTQRRRVLSAALVGTTVEWYDFFIYAQAAGLVLAPLFFAPLGPGTALAQLVAWGTLGISFFFRPLGAVLGGYLGDRYGRKGVLVGTLVVMGLATALIGVLPTYAQIGATAPILVLVLRILQGLSVGGEWGGAALLAVEHAPTSRRGYFGSFPQVGVPAGLILATMISFGVTAAVGTDQYLAWGWRVPFLLAVVLIAIGFVIRRSVSETPVFIEMKESAAKESSPLKQLLGSREHAWATLRAGLILLGSNAAGYLIVAFLSSYAIRFRGLETAPVLVATAGASVVWLVTILWSGHLSDRWGRVRTIRLGYLIMVLWLVPTFLLVDLGNIWTYFLALSVLAVGNGLTYGLIPAFFAELLPTAVRYTGISIAFSIAAILGGAFVPLIGEAIFAGTGMSWLIGVYVIVTCLVSLAATIALVDPRGADLHQHATSASPTTPDRTPTTARSSRRAGVQGEVR